MYTKKIKPFDKKVWLASPTMHGPELKYITEAYDTNWMSTVGANINEVERIAAEKAEVKYAVALSCCTAALHLCVKLAGEKLYGKPAISHGTLEGKKVFCSDMTFDATLNPVVYEGGIPIFIDTDRDSWNMDPVALEKAFEMYPEVKLVVMAHLYGFPADIVKIKSICEKHGALLIEDAAEAMGATVDGKQCGSFGDYAAISYNGNKIITGSAGGCLLTNSLEDANRTRKWSTQARENAAWHQHEEVGYNYRMSNVVAGVIRGQYAYLEDHVAQKKAIYAEDYEKEFMAPARKRFSEGLRKIQEIFAPLKESVGDKSQYLAEKVDNGINALAKGNIKAFTEAVAAVITCKDVEGRQRMDAFNKNPEVFDILSKKYSNSQAVQTLAKKLVTQEVSPKQFVDGLTAENLTALKQKVNEQAVKTEHKIEELNIKGLQ